MSPSLHHDRVRVEITDHVATVTLARGDRHNALDEAMFRGIHAAVDELREADDVRAVVLHGEGPSFCSGLDVPSFAAEGSMSVDEVLVRDDGRLANFAQRVATDWLELPVPVIAAIHGACFGGGMQIALGADLRIASPDAKLSIMEIKWGLVPDMGILVTAPRVLRLDVAKELTFTGRVVRGEEAAQLGLATRTADDPLAAAQDLAAQIANRSPDAIQRGKRLYDEGWSLPAADALVLETELQRELMGGQNQMRSIQAAVTKERVQFEPATPSVHGRGAPVG